MKGITLLIGLGFLYLLNLLPQDQNSTNYVFYLHGRIVEVQGPQAVSQQYGKYEYYSIVDSLKDLHTVILSELRPANTQVKPYAVKIAHQIDSLLNRGVSPKRITVVGASKGAIIAMQVSTLLKNRQLKFVLLAGYSNAVAKYFNFNLYGKILGFYEISDKVAGMSYKPLIDKSNGVTQFKEIVLHTMLGHGIVFKPLPEWVVPTRKWINQ
jgi:hypothetical protein